MTGADQWIRDASQAIALADRLQDPNRQDPLVIVTLPKGGGRPYFDVEALAREVGVFAEIAVLPTGAVNLAFARRLPPDTGVFGGAARVYPPTLAWVRSVRSARLITAYSSDDGRKRFDSLVRATHQARGGSTGLLTSEEALWDYDVGDAVLAMVTQVAVISLTVDLFPGVSVQIEASAVTTDARQAVDDIYSVDEVVTARVVSRDPWSLTLLDVQGADVRPAPPLMGAGAPWLTPAMVRPDGIDAVAEALPEPWQPTPGQPHRPRYAESLPLQDPAPTRPAFVSTGAAVSDGTMRADLDVARAEAAGLRRDLRTLEQGLTTTRKDLQDKKQELRAKLDENKTLRRQLEEVRAVSGIPSGQTLFFDGEEALRFDVLVSWATRLTPDDKERFPLPDYAVGADFLSSLAQTQGIDRAKVVEVIAEVLCGRAKKSAAHAPKPYRTSEDAGAPQRIRPTDGALAFRVHLQNNSPAARRLHYWLLPDKRIELWTVATHDDHSR